jgi:hypothetical protein
MFVLPANKFAFRLLSGPRFVVFGLWWLHLDLLKSSRGSGLVSILLSHFISRDRNASILMAAPLLGQRVWKSGQGREECKFLLLKTGEKEGLERCAMPDCQIGDSPLSSPELL